MAASWKGGIVPDAAVRRARRDQRSTAMRPVAVAERVVMAGWYHGRPGERRCRHQKAVLDRPPTLHDEAPNHLSPPRGRGLHGTTGREAIQAQPSMWGAFPEKPYRIRPHRRLSSIPARGERWGDRLAPGSPGTNEGMTTLPGTVGRRWAPCLGRAATPLLWNLARISRPARIAHG